MVIMIAKTVPPKFTPDKYTKSGAKELLLLMTGVSTKVLLGFDVVIHLLRLRPSQELLQRDFSA